MPLQPFMHVPSSLVRGSENLILFFSHFIFREAPHVQYRCVSQLQIAGPCSSDELSECQDESSALRKRSTPGVSWASERALVTIVGLCSTETRAAQGGGRLSPSHRQQEVILHRVF